MARVLVAIMVAVCVATSASAQTVPNASTTPIRDSVRQLANTHVAELKGCVALGAVGALIGLAVR